MQMVKNVLLSRQKTLSRKLQELFLVWHIEQLLPKERILELYFNAIEFGPRIYGIGPAAHHYFGKEASQISRRSKPRSSRRSCPAPSGFCIALQCGHESPTRMFAPHAEQ